MGHLFPGILRLRILLLFKKLFLMLEPHIVNLHVGKCAILQSLLDCESRIVGMYVHLDHVVICNYHDGITDGFQIFFEINLLLDVKIPGEHNNKFRTVTEFDVSLGLGAHTSLDRLHMCHLRNGQIKFLAKKCIVSTL